MVILRWVTGGLFSVVVGLAVVMSPFAGALEPLVAPGDWISRTVFLLADTSWPTARVCGTAAWWFLMGMLTVWFVQEVREKWSGAASEAGRGWRERRRTLA